jgi:sugar lactone lactonase YvrE
MQLKPALLLPLLVACTSSSHLPERQTTSSVLALPGATFYPESLSIAGDGTLYVGSLGGGSIVRIGPSSETAETFAAGTGKNINGVYVDDDDALLYACENDFAAMPAVPPRVLAFHLADGSAAGSYPFPQGGVCNDMVLGPAHRLYVTDSAGRIYVLPSGGNALGLFSDDPQLVPSAAGGFGADGIVWDGDATLYVNAFSDARLLRIPVAADGKAGAVTPITVTPALESPDGMRLRDAHTLVIADGAAGQITQVDLTGDTATATALATGLDSPTSVVLTEDAYWASEGQLGHFLGIIDGPPGLPFAVRRIPAK